MIKRLATHCVLPLLLLLAAPVVLAQASYFPPPQGEWERVDPATVGWDPLQVANALDIAGQRNSSGVVILHNGRIMAERYWEPVNAPRLYENSVTGTDASGHVIEDVASAQKSVVAVLVGIAQARQLLALDDTVTRYLGAGWSKATLEQERLITIKHLLSMTSGLKEDLSFETGAGSKWFYNTPAYHMVMRVVEVAAGQDRNTLTNEWLTSKLGMQNSGWTARPWATADIAVGFSTTARDLARLGIMIQAGGKWQNETVLSDPMFLADMLSSSQLLNPSYGYLWWLNGQSFSLGSGAAAARSDGMLIKSAPADLVAMQGAMDRKLYIVPSSGLVIARLGATGELDDVSFNNAFWEALMAERR